MRLSIILILALVAMVGALALLFIYSTFTRAGGTTEYLAGSAAISVLFLVIAICCAVTLERHRLPRLMRSGLWACGLALAGWFVVIWFGNELTTLNLHVEKIVAWPTVWAGLMALVGLLFLPAPPRPWWRTVRLITLILLALVALHFALYVTLEPTYPSDPRTPQSYQDSYYTRLYEYERIASSIATVLSLLALAGLSTSFLLLWLTPRKHGETAAGIPYWIACPRCTSEQTLRTGWDRCTNCGLEVCID